MNKDYINRLLNGQLEPITKSSAAMLHAELNDWIINRNSKNLDVRLLKECQRHLEDLIKYKDMERNGLLR